MKKLVKLVCMSLCAILLVSSFASCKKKGGGDDIDWDSLTPMTEHTLPLTDEPNAELTVWLGFFDNNIANLNSCENIKYLEEVTGVKINWITVSDTEYAQKFQLLPVSNKLPDIIYTQAAMGNLDETIKDGWIRDMSKHIEYFMPNYKDYLSKHDRVKKEISSIDGKVKGGITIFGDDKQFITEPQTIGLSVRSDLIESAGYTGELETIQDYYNMLKQSKANLTGLTSPLYTNFNSLWISSMMQAYGVIPTYHIKNNKVVYGPAEPEYGNWITEMRKWYGEDLIEKNFDSVGFVNGLQAPTDIVANNKSVLFTSIYSRVGTVLPIIYGLTKDQNTVITPVKSPVMNRGDRPKIMYAEEPTYSLLGGGYISADCKKSALAAKWMDFMLSEQAMRILYYGKEGVHYTVNNDPNAEFKYVHTEAYNTEAKRRGKIGSPTVGWYNWAAGYQLEKVKIEQTIADTGITTTDGYHTMTDAVNIWSDQDLVKLIKDLKFTTAEQTKLSTLQTDLDTYYAEYQVKFIKGQTSETFESYVSKMKTNLKLQECIDIYQAAYDRQNAN